MKKITQKDTKKFLMTICIIIGATLVWVTLVKFILFKVIPSMLETLFVQITSSETVEYKGFTCELKKKDGFIYNYMWDGTPEAMDIYIPDEVQGRKITAIGGYLGRLPLPFAIDVPFKDDEGNDIVWPSDYTSQTELERSGKDYGEYETYTFTIHLGKNISSLKTLYFDSYYAVKRDEHGDIEKIYFKVEYKYVVD